MQKAGEASQAEGGTCVKAQELEMRPARGTLGSLVWLQLGGQMGKDRNPRQESVYKESLYARVCILLFIFFSPG